jgi:hypothetical protein
MAKPKVRAAVAVGIALLVTVSVVAADAATNKNAGTRGVVLFIGDSNVVAASSAITTALLRFDREDNAYVPVLAARAGAGIRTHDCLVAKGCKTFDYWKLKLAGLLPKARADAIVTNFGVIDATWPGTATGPGYAYFGRKIDWFMNLVGTRPVFWTTLPCRLEPSRWREGCIAVNFELNRARSRWPNLIVVDWASRAIKHGDYMASPGKDVHYSKKGYNAWAKVVVAALDQRFPKL